MYKTKNAWTAVFYNVYYAAWQTTGNQHSVFFIINDVMNNLVLFLDHFSRIK